MPLAKKPTRLILLIAVLLFLPAFGTSWAAVGDITFSAPAIVPEEGSFTCEVQVNVGTSVLGAYDVTFTFNRAVLEITGVLGGDTGEFSAVPTYSSVGTANTTGELRVLAYQGIIDSPTGTVNIFKITFNVVGASGTSTVLSMKDITLSDPDAAPIANQVIEAQVIVGGAGGGISGTVLDMNNLPLSGVQLYAFKSSDLSQSVGHATSDETGAYAIPGLSPDTYTISAHKSGYGSTYYGGYSDQQRRRVFVTDQTATTGIDFTLQPEGTISGQVTNGAPVAGATVVVQPFDGGYSHSTTTDSNGEYTIGQFSTGVHAVQADHTGYATSYYNGAHIWNKATKVMVTSGTNTPDIDLTMMAPGGISGTVSDALENPIANVRVYAYNDPCWENPSGNSTSVTNGSYSISGLPPGNYYLVARGNDQPPHAQHYLDQWWTNGSGTSYCDEAEAITVTSSATESGRNFFMVENTTVYHPPQFDATGVFCEHRPDGSETTGIYAFIGGPSPDDVLSLTATGPSGSFTLQPGISFRTLGLLYWAGTESIIQDGTYTFSLTDSTNRTITEERTFQYSNAVPGIDSSTMTPADQAYVGTTTPTLSFVPASGTAVASHQVFVQDMKADAVWYQETLTGNTGSVTVPAGILQPYTPYRWWVRVQDTSRNNRTRSEIKTFFTGSKGAPEINNGNLLTYPGSGVIRGFIYGRSYSLAPWDMGYFKVTEDNNPSNYFYMDNQMSFMGSSPYYNWASVRYKTEPLNNGTYTYEIQDRTTGNTASAGITYTYVPIPAFSESSRNLPYNAYVNTNRPTFSWGVLSGQGPYYYSLRIWDFDRRLRLYQSPTLTDTSYRLPEDLNLPWGSSYRWQVQCWDSTGNNFSFTIRSTFTTPPLATYDFILPGGGGYLTDYRMFVVPLYLGTVADVLKMMENTLGTYDPKGYWRVFIYRNSQYVEINDTGIAELGHDPDKAFWIINRGTPTVPFSGGSAPKALYSANLRNDSWGTFGLPWDSPAIELEKIGVTDGVNTYFITDADNSLTGHVVWEYTGSGPDSGYVRKQIGDTLTPGTGFFVRVYSAVDVQLLIPPDNSGGYFSVQSNPGVETNGMRRISGEMPPPPPGG